MLPAIKPARAQRRVLALTTHPCAESRTMRYASRTSRRDEGKSCNERTSRSNTGRELE